MPLRNGHGQRAGPPVTVPVRGDGGFVDVETRFGVGVTWHIGVAAQYRGGVDETPAEVSEVKAHRVRSDVLRGGCLYPDGRKGAIVDQGDSHHSHEPWLES